MVDLKAPFLHGHSSRVADLAAAAARSMGMAEEDIALLRRAAWLHDLGRVAVPDGIWERPGRLSEGEWEQVRLHAYHTERILARAEPLAPLARIAGMHRERLDGSGCHRQAAGAEIPFAARVLALLLVDREAGREVSITLWEDEEAMRASEQAADRLRRDSAASSGQAIVSVDRYEVAVLDLPRHS